MCLFLFSSRANVFCFVVVVLSTLSRRFCAAVRTHFAATCKVRVGPNQLFCVALGFVKGKPSQGLDVKFLSQYFQPFSKGIIDSAKRSS